ncbi:3-deoxy-D-manno-octulosonic acid transferase [Thermodesulfobacteriota bacterium]
MLLLYNILMLFGIMVGFPAIVPLILVSEKRRKTVRQRLGMIPIPRSPRQSPKPIWVHALSVGEVISTLPLIDRLTEHFKDRPVVFSASTKTGFDIANNLLKEKVHELFLFPYDLFLSVKHVTRVVDPALVIIVETDIWPNFLYEMKHRNVPVILANARLSKRSFNGYKRISFFSVPLFLSFAKICTQSREDAGRFNLLGIPGHKIKTTGNLKFDQEFKPVAASQIENLKHSMHLGPDQKIFLAGSTHKGEETILADALAMIKKKYENYKFIIVPRNPQRAASVCRILTSAGLAAIRMKELQSGKPAEGFDVFVIDMIGLLGKLYAIADVAFVGGSLVNSGGHNPLEAAAFSKPLLWGPDMSDFAEIADMLVKAGGALKIRDAKSIYESVVTITSDPLVARQMGRAAYDFFCTHKGGAVKTLEVVNEYLSKTR